MALDFGLPKDPAILLSYINTKLRDEYPSFAILCKEMEVDPAWIMDTLKSIDYEYDLNYNQFV